MKHQVISVNSITIQILGLLVSACSQVTEVYTPPPTYTPVVSLTATATRQPETASPTVTSTPTSILTPTPSPTVHPPIVSLLPLPEGRIAFASDWDGDSEILVLNTDGSIIQLTSDEEWEMYPMWSPDGRWIAFSTHYPHRLGIVSGDGSGETPLKQLVRGGSPTWSPDGKQILFWWGRSIHRVNVDGTNEESIVDDPLTGQWSSCGPEDLALSPDGRWLAFTAGCGSGYEMGVGLIDLSNHDVMQVEYAARGPAWSPDGRSLAFAQVSEDDNWDIYVINVDGTGLRRLTYDLAADAGPTWSPSGKYIAFVSDQTGQFELYMMNADGTGRVRLTNGGGKVAYPDWGPGN